MLGLQIEEEKPVAKCKALLPICTGLVSPIAKVIEGQGNTIPENPKDEAKFQEILSEIENGKIGYIDLDEYGIPIVFRVGDKKYFSIQGNMVQDKLNY